MSRKILRDMGLPVPPWAQDPDSAGYDRWLEDTVRNTQPRTGEIILSRSNRRRRNALTASSLADLVFSHPDIFLPFFGVGGSRSRAYSKRRTKRRR